MKNNIQVAERLFAVLEAVIVNGGQPLQLNDLVSYTGLPSSTVARIAQTLVNCGYFEQPQRRKGYILGKKAYLLTRETDFNHRLVAVAEPIMEDFAKETGEYICLSILLSGKRIILKDILPRHKVQINSKMVKEETPYRSMSGRVMLAGYSEQEQKAFYEANGLPGKCWPEIKAEDDFLTQLAKIKNAGICFEQNKHLTAFAISVKADGKCKISLGVFMPTYRYKGEYIAKLKEIVNQLADAFQE